MATTAPRSGHGGPRPCSMSNALVVIGERWSFLILREALAGTTTFTEFRTTLGITAEVLSTRLATFVGAGIMVRSEYRDEGSRARPSYHLTEAGLDLKLVLCSLQEWSDRHTPSPLEPRLAFVDQRGGPVNATLTDATGQALECASVNLQRLDVNAQ